LRPLYFFLALSVAIFVVNYTIISADSGSKIIYSSWVLIINSLIAAGLSITILLKDRDSIKRDKTAIHLTAALVFWFLANITWGYYEIVLDVISPVPSLADLFLLSAYGFAIYRLTITYKNLDHVTDKKIVFLMILGTGLFLIYILNLTINLTETSSFRGLMLFAVTIAYPTLNSVLTVLALLILLEIKNERHHFIPWICELIAFLSVVVGDSWFAIIVLTAFVEQLWISALLLSAHYLLIAGGLVYYLRHHIRWQSKDLVYKIASVVRNGASKRVMVYSLIIASFLIVVGLYSTNAFSGSDDKFFINKKASSIQLPSSSSSSPSSSPSFLSYPNNGDGGKEFVVGAIVPFTGSFSSMGKPIKVALEKAEYDVNKHFQDANSPFRFNMLMADSKTSPEESLAAIKKLHESGAKIVIGPATSTAVSAVKEYADKNSIILISYSSTSPLLSIEGDNLFRLVPDDTYQGKIIAKRMIQDGIKVIVPFYRGDIYGNGLYKATKSEFERLGGKVEEGVKYKPHTGNFATSLHRINFLMWNQEIKKLSAIVSDSVKKYGANSVGVYTVSYDEIAPILIQAPLYETLGKVRWYGCDSTAHNHHVTKNVDSALFAMQTHFANPLYSVDSEAGKTLDLKKVLDKELHEVDSITYPATAYDSYWIAALGLYKNDTLSNNNKENLANLTKSFKEILTETAESFDGVSGKIKLNKAGDRDGGNYDFWVVGRDNNTQSYEWEKEHSIETSNQCPVGHHAPC
jgi:ABC-type branched-subunit amino acid transport system substrate-binding protein